MGLAEGIAALDRDGREEDKDGDKKGDESDDEQDERDGVQLVDEGRQRRRGKVPEPLDEGGTMRSVCELALQAKRPRSGLGH